MIYLVNNQGRKKKPKLRIEIISLYINPSHAPLGAMPSLHVAKSLTSIATLTEGCTSSIILLERALFASIAELLRESFKSVSMVPVAMATGDAAIVACSLCGGEGGAVKEFSEDCPHNKNLETEGEQNIS